jgi:hypothetical protein
MNKIIFVFLILVLSLNILYSQDNLNFEKGKKYKFNLIDDTQIRGIFLNMVAGTINVQTNDKDVITIFKDKILFVSADLTPDKYKYSLR